MTQPNKPAADPIDEIIGGFRAAQVLFTANRLGLFDVIGADAQNSDDIAQALQSDPRATCILCDALVSVGMLCKENGMYSNSDTALEYLLSCSPKSKTAILQHNAALYETWGNLYDVVISGKPVDREQIDPRLAIDEERFAAAMANVAKFSAKETAELIDFSSAKSVLDLGGGPGLYAIEFAKQNPHLHAVVMDNHKTVAVAQANIEKAGLEERVSTVPVDAIVDELVGEYDFIFVSNFVHIFSYEMNAELVKRCVRVLAPGGRICIKDFILNEDRTMPAWNALFAINMLVNTESGNCYTRNEVEEWFTASGLQLVQEDSLGFTSSLLIGKKME